MSDPLALELEILWRKAIEATSERDRDRYVEEIWLLLVRQARGTPRERGKLLEGSFRASIVTPSLAGFLEQACPAVHAWYESEFGKAAERLGALQEAASNWREAATGVPPRCAALIRVHSLTWASAALTRVGQPNPGRRCLRKAESLLRRCSPTDVPNGAGWYHAELGRVAFWKDDLETAITSYNRAYRSFTIARNRFALAETADARARLATHQGRYDDAQGELLLAAQWREPEDVLGWAKARFHTGRIFRYQEKYDEAVQALQDGRRRARQVENTRWEANLRDVLGDVYLLKGDLRAARNEFLSRVFVQSRDPVIRLRTGYQQAKLELAEAEGTQGAAQRNLLASVHRRCDKLVKSGRFQMLEEKAQLLKGRAWMLAGRDSDAAVVLKAAAKGFRTHGAWWYTAEAMLAAGQAHWAEDERAEAAEVWMAGLQVTPDDGQRKRLLQNIRRHLRKLRVPHVCSCIAELLKENRQLREGWATEHQTAAGLQDLFGQVIDGMLGLGAGTLIHAKNSVRGLKPSAQDPAALCRVEAELDYLEQLLACQRALVHCAADAPGKPRKRPRPRWVPLAELLSASRCKLPAKQMQRLHKRKRLGIFADADWIVDALRACRDFMKKWTGRVQTGCRHQPSRRQLVLEFRGTRADAGPDVGRLVDLSSPSPMILAECQVAPEAWAELACSAICIRSVGGEIVLRKAKKEVSRSKGEYLLEVRLPCDEIPPWEAQTETP